MTKRDTAKKVVGLVAQYGTGVIVYGLIKNNVVPGNPIQAVGVFVGSIAIGGIVSDAATKYTDNLIDSVFDGIDEVKKVTVIPA